MRTAWIQSSAALKERLLRPIQLDTTEPESEMPPYMELFLAHLRLLVGVPFDYLVADDRLLPDESIRFFYLDRSWTDRLVDGAIAVGKIGTREQAHHQGHAPAVNQQLDLSERIVRIVQRGMSSFADAKTSNDSKPAAADTITGFLLRSAAVSGWPQMDVRAYKTDIPETFDPADPQVAPQQLTTLRLELLSPALMIALFQGVPQLVTLEEPHQGVQFGIHLDGYTNSVYLRDPTGEQIQIPPLTQTPAQYWDIPLPVRAANNRVVHVTELRRQLNMKRATVPTAIEVTGAASFAIAVLDPPWRQRFEGTVDEAGTQATSGGFATNLQLAQRVSQDSTLEAVRNLVALHGD